MIGARTDRVALCALIGIGLVFAAVLARVAQLQHAPSPELKRFVHDRARPVHVAAARGALYDRRGRLLASSRTGRRLFLDPLRFPHPKEPAIAEVARASGYSFQTLHDRVMPAINENRRRRATGERQIRFVPVGGILSDARADAVSALDLPGVHLERRPVRESLTLDSLAPIVGKVGFEHTGLLGIERELERRLAPEHGSASVVRDAGGNPLWIEGGEIAPARRGQSVMLSLDAEIQRLAEEELRQGLEDGDAAAGRLVAVDVRTGEILAMLDVYRDVGAAAFDPRTIPEPGETWPRYDVVPPDPRRAIEPALARVRCVEDAYEPGSTFKPFIWSAVLEQGDARTDETLETHGGRWRTEYGRAIEDVVRRNEQTVRDVLVNSSNIGMVKLASRLDDAQLRDAIRKFGFGAATGLPVPGEADGLVTPAERWNKYTSTSVAFGYEVAVTPVQMIRAFCAFARSGDLAGTLPRLTLRRREVNDEQLLHRVLPPEVAHAARDALTDVARIMVDRGRRAGRIPEHAPAYDLFGKSGTARVPRPDGRGYFEKQYISSFVAAAPARDPRVAVIVVIDDPGPDRIASRTHYGSAVAGPVVARLLHRTLEYLGVAHDADPAEPDVVASTP